MTLPSFPAVAVPGSAQAHFDGDFARAIVTLCSLGKRGCGKGYELHDSREGGSPHALLEHHRRAWRGYRSFLPFLPFRPSHATSCWTALPSMCVGRKSVSCLCVCSTTALARPRTVGWASYASATVP